jgi:type IV secretory pathway TrbD component
VLPLDVLVIRSTLAAVVGLVAGEWLSWRWALVVGLVVLYVLLSVARTPVTKWPPA